MKKEYKRDLYHNYLILSEGAAVDSASYRVRILMTNRIPLLLETHLEQLDGRELFYYEITSRQSLEEVWHLQPLGMELLSLLLNTIGLVLQELQNYLLRPDGLQMTPDLIFLDPELKEVNFCYYPGSEKGFREQLKELAELLLPRLCQQEKDAMVLGYAFYRHCQNEELSAGDLAALLHEPEVLEAGLSRAAAFDGGRGTGTGDRSGISGGFSPGEGYRGNAGGKRPASGRRRSGRKEKQKQKKTKKNTGWEENFPAGAELFPTAEGGERASAKKHPCSDLTPAAEKRAGGGCAAFGQFAPDRQELQRRMAEAEDPPKARKEKPEGRQKERRKEKHFLSDRRDKKTEKEEKQNARKKRQSAQRKRAQKERAMEPGKGEGHRSRILILASIVIALMVLILLQQFALLTEQMILFVLLILIAGCVGLVLQSRKSQESAEDEEDGYLTADWLAEDFSENLMEGSQESLVEETVFLRPAADRNAPEALLRPEDPSLPMILLEREHTIIGKKQGVADVVLPRPEVSRIHARISRGPEGFTLTDLNSKNGTRLNGEMIASGEPLPLREGDRISFAGAAYLYDTRESMG